MCPKVAPALAADPGPRPYMCVCNWPCHWTRTCSWSRSPVHAHPQLRPPVLPALVSSHWRRHWGPQQPLQPLWIPRCALQGAQCCWRCGLSCQAITSPWTWRQHKPHTWGPGPLDPGHNTLQCAPSHRQRPFLTEVSPWSLKEVTASSNALTSTQGYGHHEESEKHAATKETQ